MYLTKLALAVGKEDRFALMLPAAFRFAINDNVLCEIYQEYRCSGVLVEVNTPLTLYHLTRSEKVFSILSDGFHVDPTDDTKTYGGDVVYAYRHITDFLRIPDGCSVLRVEVSKCWYAIATYDKDPDMGEYIFYPTDVVNISEVL